MRPYMELSQRIVVRKNSGNTAAIFPFGDFSQNSPPVSLFRLTEPLSLVKRLSAIFTIAQTAFYYLILCATAGTGNCNINLFIYTSVWCGNHNILSFSVYLDIPDISPGNKFFQFFYRALSQSPAQAFQMRPYSGHRIQTNRQFLWLFSFSMLSGFP